MKIMMRILFSVFFAIAIGVHIYYIFESDKQPLWWHMIYFVTYGVCWWMIFSKNKNRTLIYAVMSLFPFFTHVYYAVQHSRNFDADFWVCLLVCVILPMGFLWMRYESATETLEQ